MGIQEMDFPLAVGAPAGNDLNWSAILDDDNIAPGRATGFHVRVSRPIAAGPLGAPGASVFVITLPPGPPVSIDRPGPVVGVDPGNEFAAGEAKRMDFQVTNDMATGVNPAAYFIFAVLIWPGPSFAISPVFVVPGAPG